MDDLLEQIGAVSGNELSETAIEALGRDSESGVHESFESSTAKESPRGCCWSGTTR